MLSIFYKAIVFCGFSVNPFFWRHCSCSLPYSCYGSKTKKIASGCQLFKIHFCTSLFGIVLLVFYFFYRNRLIVKSVDKPGYIRTVKFGEINVKYISNSFTTW